MGKPRRKFLVLLLCLVGALVLTAAVARHTDPTAESPGAVQPGPFTPLQAGQKVTFLELGSVGCKPCEAMVPVLQAVRERYGDRVEVVFHDVKKDHAVAGEWKIRLIPTQIFLRPDGSEHFRHEGYFPLEEVEEVLGDMGIR